MKGATFSFRLRNQVKLNVIKGDIERYGLVRTTTMQCLKVIMQIVSENVAMLNILDMKRLPK